MTQDQAADGAIREVSAETTSVDAEKQMETTDKSPSAVLTGAKLFIMMLAVVVVFILVLMDVSIVSTVSLQLVPKRLPRKITDFYPRHCRSLQATSTPSATLDGMVLHISWPMQRSSH